MPETILPNTLYYSVSGTIELVSRPMQNSCVLKIKYTDEAFSFIQLNCMDQVLLIPSRIDKFLCGKRKVEKLSLYYTELSKTLHDSIGVYFSHIFTFFPELGKPYFTHALCAIDSKICINNKNVIVNIPKQRTQENLNSMSTRDAIYSDLIKKNDEEIVPSTKKSRLSPSY